MFIRVNKYESIYSQEMCAVQGSWLEKNIVVLGIYDKIDKKVILKST